MVTVYLTTWMVTSTVMALPTERKGLLYLLKTVMATVYLTMLIPIATTMVLQMCWKAQVMLMAMEFQMPMTLTVTMMVWPILLKAS